LNLLAIFIVFAFLFQPIAAHASPYPIAISDYSQKPTGQSESFECSTDMDVPQDECEALVAMYEGNNERGGLIKIIGWKPIRWGIGMGLRSEVTM